MSIMFAKLTKLSILLLGVSAAGLLSSPAQAEKMSLNDEFKEAYFTHGKNAFVQSNIVNQFNTIVGLTGYPEQHINRDAQAVDKLYKMGMAEQSSLGARIMTRDLPNPYDTSLRENPSYSAAK